MADPEIWRARTINPSYTTRITRVLRGRGWMNSEPPGSEYPRDEHDEKVLREPMPGFSDYLYGSNVQEENIDRRRNVRSLPSWIHSLHDEETVEESQPFIANPNFPVIPPQPVKAAHHNYMPDPKTQFNPEAGRGKGWHHARSREAVTTKFPGPDHYSRWQPFAQASLYRQSEDGELVGDDWLQQHMSELDEPYEPPRNSTDVQNQGSWLTNKKMRSKTFLKFQRMIMKNPFVPLLLRLMVIAFACTALGLGVQIYRESRKLNYASSLNDVVTNSGNVGAICKQQASTYMAFIVDSIAVVYLLYITYDEYFSKPIGLRSSGTKMRLLFLDLFFIIFAAANLSLAFNTLADQQWSCYSNDPTNNSNVEAAQSTCIQNTTLCRSQQALCIVLVIAEVAWVMTFAISILRVVEKVSTEGDGRYNS